MSKSCVNCPAFMGQYNMSQERLYGQQLGVPACPVKGQLLGAKGMSAEDQDDLMKEVAEKCNSYGKPVTDNTPQYLSLNIGIGVPPAPSEDLGKPSSCRGCHYFVPASRVRAAIGVEMGLCSKFGNLIPEAKGSFLAKQCAAGKRVALGGDPFEQSVTPDDHHNSLLANFQVSPILVERLELDDTVGSNFEAPKPAFIEPSEYKTDLPVSAAHVSQGIRAWRKIYDDKGKRSVVVPVFDYNFFNAEERAKIPKTGDDTHPEHYIDHQNIAYKAAVLWRELDETPALNGVAGTGKGHPVDTKVLTPEGWRRIGDVRVGDEIIGKNGQATKIIGVFPRGRLHVNKVTMTDGSSVVVDDDHLWQVSTIDKRTSVRSTRDIKSEGTYRVVTSASRADRVAYKFAIPMVSPVQFPERELVIHPYVLGVLLANGHLGTSALYYTKDSYVSGKVGQLVDQLDRSVDSHPVPRYRILGGTWDGLVQLGLNGKLSAQKFIPEQYLHSSEHQRRELLAGLMDCDGTVTQGGGNTKYCTTSQHLADGVVQLVQSLGGTATVQYSDHWQFGKDYEKVVNISLGDSNPFQSPLKQSKRNRSVHRAPVRKIKSIESAGEAEVVCISVAAEDQLYVTEDYIVTHNTEFFRYMSWLMCLPFERVSITSSSEIDELAGKTAYQEGRGTYFEYGRIPQSWSKPCVIVIDEPNVGPPDVWQFIRPLTDNSKQLVLDMNAGERIDRNENCYMGMAFNPAWDARNIGAEQISDADGSRLMHIFVDYPSEKLEKQIIRERCSVDGYEIEEATLNSIMRIAKQLRALSEDGTLGVTWGLRPQIKVARATRWFDMPQAYRLAAADLLEPEQAELILDTVRNNSR